MVYDFRSDIDGISPAATDANANAAGNQAFDWGGNATVFADVTGDKVADFSVQVNGVAALATGDFLL